MLYMHACINVVPAHMCRCCTYTHVCIDVHVCMCVYVLCVCVLNMCTCIEGVREFRVSCLSLDIKECHAVNKCSGASCLCRNIPLRSAWYCMWLSLFILTTGPDSTVLYSTSVHAPLLLSGGYLVSFCVRFPLCLMEHFKHVQK